MRKLFLILIIGVLFISCKKERTFHITAKNAATGAPYPGLYYEVVCEWKGPFENKYKTVGSGQLDANGEVYFTKRLDKNSSYSITVEEPDNTCYNKDVYLYPGGETNFEAAFEFAECAYLKLNINNVNCQGAEDTMRFRTRYSYSDWEGWSGARIGCYSYQTPYPFEVPSGWRIYEWEVNRNGVISTYVDSIYLNEGIDNGFFQMNY